MLRRFSWLVVLLALSAVASEPFALWPEALPADVAFVAEDAPLVSVHLPDADAATGMGIVVLPGGGYQNLALDHEGDQIAAWCNEHGIAAMIVRYRRGEGYGFPAPQQDAQRAMRLFRSRAAEWGVAPDQIGLMGFSAGGHLAASIGTLYSDAFYAPVDAVDEASARPDFLILCYPVITMQEHTTHQGSRRNLLGEAPDPALVERLSAHLQVDADTPPAFLLHTTEDIVVLVENSVLFYEALRKHGVPAALHIFEHGRHGVGLATGMPGIGHWPSLLLDWLRALE